MTQTRTCGTCVACCVAFDIGALEKPAATRCRHLAAAGGCAIYDRAPHVCRLFECAWLTGDGGWGGDDTRPDRLGVLFTPGDPDSVFPPGSGVPLLVAYELRLGALDSLEARQLLEHVARTRLVGIQRFGWEEGDGNLRAFVGPPELLRVLRPPPAERAANARPPRQFEAIQADLSR
jgi:hypothetical protein